jgi:hypothetical protein
MVEREHLIAQYRQPVEVLGALVVLDRRDRRLQRRNVRFQRDRDLVAETALGPMEEHPQEPRRGGRRGQPERGNKEAAPVVMAEPVRRGT